MKDENKTINYLSQVVLGEDEQSEVEVLRVGTIQDRGLKITSQMLKDFVQNFKDKVYGTQLQVNLEHNRGGEAAGWITELLIKGKKLFAKVEWTELGSEKIEKKLFKFVSAEFTTEFPHHKTGDIMKNVFIGLALTNTPALKGQNALTLEEELNYLLKQKNMFKTFLNLLKSKEFVSKEEKVALAKMLEEATGEVKEEVKEDVAAVDAKPEEAAAPEKKEEEEEKVEEKKEESLTEQQMTESLKEKDLRIAKLEEAQARTDLSEIFLGEMTVSKEKAVGFTEKSKNNVIEFMLSLTPGQRVKFQELLTEIRSVELKELGSSKAEDANVSLQDKIVSRTKELLAENPKMHPGDAQKQASKELDVK